jgi:hypothetical protein
MLQSNLKSLPTSKELPSSDDTSVDPDFGLNLSQLLSFSPLSYLRKLLDGAL